MNKLLSAITRSISVRWRILTGNTSDFVLEARIFNSITLCASVVAAAYIPYDIFAGLYVAAFSSLLFSAIFSYEYYRSRFRRLPHRSFVFGLFGLAILSVNYFANAGIAGSTDLIWPVYLLLLLTICPLRHQLVWVVTYLVVFGLVHVAEQQYPELVRYPFRPGHGQFTDRITAFPLPVMGIAIVVGLFRRNYDRERATVAQRDAEKSRLLSILSHDLRAPFIQIRQYLELWDDAALTTEERTRMEQALRRANNQTLDLVTNLLYWSRSQLEGTVLHLTLLPLALTLDNTLAIANALAGQKNITLTHNIDHNIRVTADADMLQLVVRNLLQNAIKFTASAGAISVDTVVIDRRCRITVSDNGMGITPEQLKTLFLGAAMPAYGTANEKGVGLGLQLCSEFMERQGGSISVESTLGEGSRFTIELPLG